MRDESPEEIDAPLVVLAALYFGGLLALIAGLAF